MNGGVRIVTIDGNIGAGKSTVLEALRSRGYAVLPEPIAQWSPYLEAAYGGDIKGALRLQLAVWRDRCMNLAQNAADAFHASAISNIVFVERSPMFQLETFIRANYENGNLNQLDVKLLETLYASIDNRPHMMFYLHTPPNICYRRVESRGRPYEHGLRDYIGNLHELHEKVSLNTVSHSLFGALPEIIAIDGDQSPAEVADDILSFIIPQEAMSPNSHHRLTPIDPVRENDPLNFIPLPPFENDTEPCGQIVLERRRPSTEFWAAAQAPPPGQHGLTGAEIDVEHHGAADQIPQFSPLVQIDTNPSKPDTNTEPPRPVLLRVADALEGLGKSIHILANALRSSAL